MRFLKGLQQERVAQVSRAVQRTDRPTVTIGQDDALPVTGSQITGFLPTCSSRRVRKDLPAGS